MIRVATMGTDKFARATIRQTEKSAETRRAAPRRKTKNPKISPDSYTRSLSASIISSGLPSRISPISPRFKHSADASAGFFRHSIRARVRRSRPRVAQPDVSLLRRIMRLSLSLSLSLSLGDAYVRKCLASVYVSTEQCGCAP